MLKSAFNFVLSKHSRSMTIMRVDGPNYTIKVTPSNFFRQLEGPAEIVAGGYEFVIAKDALDAINWGAPKRSDRLVDADLGALIIGSIEPMYDFGGSIMGYRVRTQ